VTTIGFSNVVGNVLLTMQAADNLAYTPEWVLLGNYAIDNNTIATVLPKDQTAHMFGITGLEWPQVAASTECYRAVATVNPGFTPNSTTCYLFWKDLVFMMNGLQGAGPDLTPARFQQAEFAIGHHFLMSAWSQGGGFGPGDYTYPDSVAEIWYDSAATDPSNGAPGAFRFIHNGLRYERGRLPSDDSELFRSGSSQAPS